LGRASANAAARARRDLRITPFDRQRFASTVTAVLGELDYNEDAVDAAAVQATDGRQPYRVTGHFPSLASS
jgi:hypothetical protein